MAENNTLLEKLDGLVARFEEVSTLITDPNVISDQKRYVKLTKEYKELGDLMAARKEYLQCLNGLEEAKMMMSENDPEMKEMAREEAAACEARIPELEEEIKLLLVPADPQDDRNAILEIRGGTGGDEAAIFAGANATMELYEKLVDFARRHQIVIVNDNPYSFILNRKPISILNVPGAKECCIEFNSMSKSHNMPGWRVGMLATNATFVQWILKIKSNIDSGTFRPLQLAAAQAYHNSTEWHEEANIQTYARRRKLAEEIMHTLGCTFDPEQVGMFLWGRIPDHYADVEELTEKVLHEARVFITPGFIFGSNGKRYIRISLCAKEPQLEEALKRIQAIMNK